MQLPLTVSKKESAALTARMAARAWRTHEVGLILGTHLLLFLLASFTGLFFYEEQIPAAELAITYLIYILVLGLIHFICRQRGGTWASSFGLGLRQLKFLALSPLLYLIVFPLLVLAANAWHFLLEGSSGQEAELQDVAKAITNETSWLQGLYIFTAIVIAPLFEEVMFRGLLFPYLAKRGGLALGITMTALFFAVVHFHLPSFVPLALLSAALCLAYWRTGSLWICIGMHTIFNTVTILVLNGQG